MMARDISAGILLYRVGSNGLQVLVAHPGGPIWRNRHEGAWSIPKGLLEGGEDPLVAAAREFAEETGVAVPVAGALELGSTQLKSGKLVHAWALEGDMSPGDLVSNSFEIEWPPRSGRLASFPEIDRVAWVTPAEAAVVLNPALVVFVDRLVDHLATSP